MLREIAGFPLYKGFSCYVDAGLFTCRSGKEQLLLLRQAINIATFAFQAYISLLFMLEHG